MTNEVFNKTQMAVLMPILNPFIDIIVERVSERLSDRILSATMQKEPKFYSRKETAQLLHITLPTLARMTEGGLITAKRAGRRVLYSSEEIDKAVQDNKIQKYKRLK